MSKAAVKRVASISPNMKNYVDNSIESAIFTDISIFTDEPDAMIGLITMEAIMAGIDNAIKFTLMYDMLKDVVEDLFNALD